MAQQHALWYEKNRFSFQIHNSRENPAKGANALRKGQFAIHVYFSVQYIFRLTPRTLQTFTEAALMKDREKCRQLCEKSLAILDQEFGAYQSHMIQSRTISCTFQRYLLFPFMIDFRPHSPLSSARVRFLCFGARGILFLADE